MQDKEIEAKIEEAMHYLETECSLDSIVILAASSMENTGDLTMHFHRTGKFYTQLGMLTHAKRVLADQD